MRILSMIGSQRQRGVSLLVALVFLVIMAMLGVTVANVTTLQERMAGNTRDRDLALQAAEAALRDAEIRLADPAFQAAAQPITNPILANDDTYWTNCFTARTDPCTAALTYTPVTPLPSTDAGAVAAQPRYIVQSRTLGGTNIYRVTVYAVGGTADAVVILQAEY